MFSLKAQVNESVRATTIQAGKVLSQDPCERWSAYVEK